MADRGRFAAVDSRFLADLESNCEDAQEVYDGLHRLRFHLLVTPTPLRELQDARLNSPDRHTREIAEGALRDYGLWHVLDPPISPPYDRVAEIIAGKLIGRDVLRNPILNDALVLAEAGLEECKLLLTHRKSLLEANLEGLSVAMLEENDVSMPFLVSCEGLLAAFQKIT